MEPLMDQSEQSQKMSFKKKKKKKKKKRRADVGTTALQAVD